MLNKSKLLEFFDASKITEPIHIIGCGAIGSHIAEQLARMGCSNIHLWDFDTVSAHNITNQMFMDKDIGELKTGAVQAMMVDINYDLLKTTILHNEGWKNELLNGYVFLCVDKIDVRKDIIEKNKYNPNCVAFFDFRMRLTDAQHYMSERTDYAGMERLIAGMDFTSEEASAATPKSACGTELSVVYTVKTITALGIANFAKLVLGQPTKHTILVDLNLFECVAFPMD